MSRDSTVIPFRQPEARLTAAWQTDYDAWQKRDLSARRFVYVWADGVYLQARL